MKLQVTKSFSEELQGLVKEAASRGRKRKRKKPLAPFVPAPAAPGSDQAKSVRDLKKATAGYRGAKFGANLSGGTVTALPFLKRKNPSYREGASNSAGAPKSFAPNSTRWAGDRPDPKRWQKQDRNVTPPWMRKSTGISQNYQAAQHLSRRAGSRVGHLGLHTLKERPAFKENRQARASSAGSIKWMRQALHRKAQSKPVERSVALFRGRTSKPKPFRGVRLAQGPTD
jgi:hypothetical protein